MRKQVLQPLNVLLDSMFRDLGISDRIRLEQLKRRWRKIFSGSLSMHTSPAELKENRLVIAVDSPAWLQHLKFLNKEILAKISAYGIKSIQFRLGSVRSDSELSTPTKEAAPDDFRELTSEEYDAINRVIAEIEDDELKALIGRAMEKAARRKMHKR
jgi:hypothetical protein